jgi:excisionase family DNA binding protein
MKWRGDRLTMMTDMLTTQQAADLLGLSRKTVQSLIKRKRLPADRHGRDWMIKREDVENHQPGKPGPKPKVAVAPQG